MATAGMANPQVQEIKIPIRGARRWLCKNSVQRSQYVKPPFVSGDGFQKPKATNSSAATDSQSVLLVFSAVFQRDMVPSECAEHVSDSRAA